MRGLELVWRMPVTGGLFVLAFFIAATACSTNVRAAEPDLEAEAPVASTAKSCLEAAETQLLSRFPEARDMLSWHVKRGCGNSRRAVAGLDAAHSGEKRQKYCRRHVLVPVYLNICLHFRDVILAPAFAPCWKWAREQFGRCLDGDAAWFARP